MSNASPKRKPRAASTNKSATAPRNAASKDKEKGWNNFASPKKNKLFVDDPYDL